MARINLRLKGLNFKNKTSFLIVDTKKRFFDGLPGSIFNLMGQVFSWVDWHSTQEDNFGGWNGSCQDWELEKLQFFGVFDFNDEADIIEGYFSSFRHEKMLLLQVQIEFIWERIECVFVGDGKRDLRIIKREVGFEGEDVDVKLHRVLKSNKYKIVTKTDISKIGSESIKSDKKRNRKYYQPLNWQVFILPEFIFLTKLSSLYLYFYAFSFCFIAINLLIWYQPYLILLPRIHKL